MTTLLSRAEHNGWAPFTSFPDLPPTAVFPTPGIQAFLAVYFFSMTSLLSFMIARRSLSLNPFSLASWRAYSLPRFAGLAVYFFSLCFVLYSGIIVLGVGTSNERACLAAVMNNNTFYPATKVFIYLFLIEKVHIVGNTRLPRLKSKLYLACMLAMVPYIVQVILADIGHISFVIEDGTCFIGLEKFGSFPILVYGVFLDIFFTALFVWPLLKSRLASPKLRAVATRTMLSSLIALVTTSINIIVLIAMGGVQPAWTCLVSVTADVMVNALVLFYVTSTRSRAPPSLNSDDDSRTTYQLPKFVSRSPQSSVTTSGSVDNGAGRSDYTDFPAPSEDSKDPEIDPQDGGGYVIPRDALTPTSSHGASDVLFSQKPFSVEDREKQRAKGRSAEAASSGVGLLGCVKNGLARVGVIPDSWARQHEDTITRTNSIEVHVETAIATADFPSRPQPVATTILDRQRAGHAHGRLPFVRHDSDRGVPVPTLANQRSTHHGQRSVDIDLDDFDDDDSTKISSLGHEQPK